MLSPRTARLFIGKLLRQIWGVGTDMGEFWESHWRYYYWRGLGGLGQRLGILILGGSVWGRGFGQIQVIGYVNIVVPGEGLEPEIRNVETWGLGTYIGDVNIRGGGGVQVRRDKYKDMAIWGMFILWEGWGIFGTNIGYVNIVGGRGPGAEFGMLIFGGGPCGGFGTDIGYVNIVGPGKGKGQGWGTDIALGMLILGGGVGDRNGYAHIMGVGVLGQTLVMLIF